MAEYKNVVLLSLEKINFLISQIAMIKAEIAIISESDKSASITDEFNAFLVATYIKLYSMMQHSETYLKNKGFKLCDNCQGAKKFMVMKVLEHEKGRFPLIVEDNLPREAEEITCPTCSGTGLEK